MDPVVSLQISGNSGGGSSQLNVNSSVNHFQSNSPTSVSSKHRHSSGGSGPGQPPGAVADHFSCSSHHNSPKVSPPISAAPQISSSSAAVANFSHVPQVMTISNQPLPYNPEILVNDMLTKYTKFASVRPSFDDTQCFQVSVFREIATLGNIGVSSKLWRTHANVYFVNISLAKIIVDSKKYGFLSL